jgi:hypothetical protein
MFISNVRTHQPLIENWELISPKAYGEGYHQKVAKAFHAIWNNSEVEELIFNRDAKGLIREQISENTYRIITSGELEIRGTIYGYNGHIQGSSILVDNIASITRIKEFNGNHNLSYPLIITTKNGKQYRIYAKECTYKTRCELSNITMLGEVETRTGH